MTDLPKITKRMADEIKEKMSNAMLFGKKIDINDHDQCLVAAYNMAKQESMEDMSRERDMYKLFRSVRK